MYFRDEEHCFYNCSLYYPAPICIPATSGQKLTEEQYRKKVEKIAQRIPVFENKGI